MIVLSNHQLNEPRFDLDVENAIATCDGFQLLGSCRPTDNWTIDNMIGHRVMGEAIEYDRKKSGHGYFTHELLMELTLYGHDWRGIKVGAYTELTNRLFRIR